mmetsp:Transcript_82714/g.230665  ORF Transcript_82714/g.230665 Transcript_82714/m.230665 type:complete len:205 (-) Transcript_82714:82-696(-)
MQGLAAFSPFIIATIFFNALKEVGEADGLSGAMERDGGLVANEVTEKYRRVLHMAGGALTPLRPNQSRAQIHVHLFVRQVSCKNPTFRSLSPATRKISAAKISDSASATFLSLDRSTSVTSIFWPAARVRRSCIFPASRSKPSAFSRPTTVYCFFVSTPSLPPSFWPSSFKSKYSSGPPPSICGRTPLTEKNLDCRSAQRVSAR